MATTVDVVAVAALDYTNALRTAFARCDHVIVLTEPLVSPSESDARALLATLQASNDFASRSAPGTVVTELLDETDALLARQITSAEFIVSDKLASQMMAQLAETPDLHAVFEQLLDPAGADLFAHPVTRYSRTGEPVTFAALVSSAAARDQIAIGYRLDRHARNQHEGFGIVMNPPRDEEVSFEPGDHLIVVAKPTPL